ncbi:hypothetical protein MON38_05470 [Hymenobacter sp. DH14]|uniref:Uncharacterized protein n=1 Tax=Hymenobacter cyanobacteriorum TaxID=2926463 RepID=A0A9X1VH76_9BACT|nr:hypothetical protein [Hymenobacter cyanobacteriorum]MCI1186860.1 hypothetical protein [Hymenobacter cyanobacteriorum]
MKLPFGDKLEIMLRDGRLPMGALASLIASVNLISKLSDSDYSLPELLIAAVLIIFGLFLIYQSIDRHKLLWELAADTSRVTGSFEPSRTTSQELDGTTYYRVAYSYQFEGVVYTHCVETSYPEKYSGQELIFIQRLRPENAVFAADLPGVVRKKLLAVTSL